MRLVLASASPRRRDLLRAAGLEFDVHPADIDESQRPGEAATRYVERIAREKALAVCGAHPDRVVLAADTVVVVDGHVLGKPADAPEACQMLARLSDRGHDVLTAVAVAAGPWIEAAVARAAVRMRALTPGEIEAYVRTGEPMDKAGAYAIQGGAASFVLSVDGAHDTVVGLPMREVGALLDSARRAGGPSGAAG